MLTTEQKPEGIFCRDKNGVLVACISYSHDQFKKKWLVRFFNGWSSNGMNCQRFNTLQAAEYLALAVYLDDPSPTVPPMEGRYGHADDCECTSCHTRRICC